MNYLALDTETTGLGYWDEAFMVSAAWRDPIDGTLESHVWKPKDLELMQYVPAYDGFVFHNGKFDVQKLVLGGVMRPPIDWTYIHDTECLSHLINEQQPKALKRLARDLLGLETDEEDVLRAERRRLKLKKADGYDALPREVIEPYARKDAEFTLLLFEKLWPIVQADEELLRLYQEEQELMGVLYDMMAAGMRIDTKYVDDMTKALATEILKTDLHIRDLTGDEEFNSNSWQQIQAALQSRGHNPPDTKKVTLESLGDELADAILKLRHATKQHSTYFKNIQAETRDGILHPWFKQWGTRGRRFASGGVEDS